MKNGNLIFVNLKGVRTVLKEDLPYPLLMFFKSKYTKEIPFNKSKGRLLVTSRNHKKKIVAETDVYSDYLRNN